MGNNKWAPANVHYPKAIFQRFGGRCRSKNREEQTYTTTTKIKSFGELFGLKEKLSRPVVDTKIYTNQESHIYHRNLSSVAPTFFGKEKVPHWSRAVYAFFIPEENHKSRIDSRSNSRSWCELTWAGDLLGHAVGKYGCRKLRVHSSAWRQQLGRRSLKQWELVLKVLFCFLGERTFWDSSLVVSLTLWDEPVLCTPHFTAPNPHLPSNCQSAFGWSPRAIDLYPLPRKFYENNSQRFISLADLEISEKERFWSRNYAWNSSIVANRIISVCWSPP